MNIPFRAFGWAEPALVANAARIPKAFAGGLRPPPRISVSDWAAKYRQFGEDAAYPGPWDRERAPYLDEMQDCLSPFDSASVVAIGKCAQSGGSASGENWIGYVSDVAPGPMMYVGPTISAAKDWLAEKFWPMAQATPRLNPDRNGAIMPKRQRDGQGTTALRVRFRRSGWMLIAGANSAATLRQHSIRYVIEDDLDQFPDDLDHQGSPESMVSARLTVFTRQGIAKRLKISTPTNAGASKIETAVKAGDQRRYYLKCRRCGSRFDPIFSDLVWPDGHPDKAYLVAPCCKQPLQHWEKPLMSLADGWLATAEDEAGEKPGRVLTEDEFQAWRAKRGPGAPRVGGRQPSFTITGIISAFLTWSELCVEYVAAVGDNNKLKSWTNLKLGEPFEVRGEAPDYEKLKALVEQDWGHGRRLPVGCVVATLGADVQGDGIYYEILGWGPEGESWAIEAAFLPGATAVKGEGAWIDLDKVVKRGVVYPGGQSWPLDQACVDAGYNTEAAEAFCRAYPARLAVFGRPGWTKPVLGRADPTRYETHGKRTGQASRNVQDRVFQVGTYGVKLTFYGYLRKTLEIVEAEGRGERLEARGRCHFGPDLAEDYFEQITAETIETKVVNGHAQRRWTPLKSRPNHFLDCRVYNFAAAAKLKLDTLTDEDWEALRLERYAPPSGGVQGELFEGVMAPAQRPAAPADASGARTEPPAGGWINTTGGDWL